MTKLFKFIIISLAITLTASFSNSQVEKEDITKWSKPSPGPSENPQYTDACPTDLNTFGPWFKNKMISTMETPEQIPVRAGWVRYCLKRLPAANEIQRCSENLLTLSKAYVGQYGLGVSPDEVPVNPPLVSILPQALNSRSLAKIMKDGTDAQLEEALKNLNPPLPESAKTMVFYSGSSHARTVTIILPGRTEDIYYHYIGDMNPKHTHIGADVIRARRDASGQMPQSPKLDYYSVDYVSDTSLPLITGRGDRCDSCHRSGTRAITPDDGIYNIFPNKAAEGKAIYAWFDKFRPKSEAHRNRVSYKHLAPEIGGSENSRRKDLAFLASCSKQALPNASPAQLQKIGGNMNCLGCHTDDTRTDVLRVPMEVKDFALNTLDSVILRGHMPEGADKVGGSDFLKPSERRALLSCLKQDYFGGFKQPYWSAGNSQPGTLMKYLTANCGNTDQASTDKAAKKDKDSKRAPAAAVKPKKK